MNNTVIHPNLRGLPPVNWITLADCTERHEYMRSQFRDLGIVNHRQHMAKFDGRVHDYTTDPNIQGRLRSIENINSAGIATALSHAAMIQSWLAESDPLVEPWGFFCEDDMDLTLARLWPFSWPTVMMQWPADSMIMQLSLIRNDGIPPWMMTKPHPRYKGNWGAGAYILRRAHAERIVRETFRPDGTITVDIDGDAQAWPCVEHTIIRDNKLAWTWPIFTEQIRLKSTQPRGEDVGQHNSARAITEFWQQFQQ